ncbi:MAG: hypothetical protein KFH98_04855 [Gemmatimonadetes bacterium]|nr:hypothetical protein [Gemmatimonadota bacterium]
MARRRSNRVASRQAARPGRIADRQPTVRRPRSVLEHSLRRFVRRRPLLIAAALAALHITFALITFAPQPHTGGDNAAYITLAQSMLESGTYTELWDPALPPHTKYPPAFPAILAIAIAIGLKPWVQLKLVVLALSATAVAFSFLWIRARRRAVLALGIGILLAVAPGVLREGRWILSDVPFWAFTMIGLWAFERLRRDDWTRFAIAAAALILAYFTRSAGLPLLIAAFAWLGWRGHWRQLAALAVLAGVPALLWWLRARSLGPSGYVSEFWLVDPYTPAMGRIGLVDLLQRIVQNDWKYMSWHMPVLLTGGAAGGVVAISVMTFLLALAGWVRRVRMARVADLFVPLYIGLIFVWPEVWSGERFLLPVLPLILYYAADALLAGLRRLVPAYAFAGGAATLALFVLLALPGIAEAARIGRACTALYQAGDRIPCVGAVWDDFFGLAEDAPHMLPDDAVVLSRKPRLFYALGGHRSSIYPFSQDPGQFFATADSVGARYVIFDQLGGTADAYLRPVLMRKPQAFCIMRVTPATGTMLFGIRPDHTAVPDAGQAALSAPPPAFAFCDAGYWRSPEAMRTMGGN